MYSLIREAVPMPANRNPSLASKILIIDDQVINVKLLESMLYKYGYKNIRSLTDSRQALCCFLDYQPDLILLDLNMPFLDGIDVLSQIRRLPGQKAAPPILVLSGDMSSEAKNKAISNGATGYLTKPFSILELLQRVKDLLDNFPIS